MNEHAEQIKRIDLELEENYQAQRQVWANFTKTGEFGDVELTAAGKRRIAELGAERKNLEATAAALYRM